MGSQNRNKAIGPLKRGYKKQMSNAYSAVGKIKVTRASSL